MRFVYNVLFAVFFLFTLPYYFLRLWRRGNWQKGVGQRFGIYDSALKARLKGRRVIWFHAVSVGEVNLCALLVKAFGDSLSQWTIVVSTTTTTGMGELDRKLPESVIKIYYPVDFLPAVNRALRVIDPRLVVLVEAEIWPNLLWRLADRDTPTFLVNARLSDRSAKRYAQFKGLFDSIFSSLACVGVQNETDATTVASVGCHPKRISVTGNLKFDAVDLTTQHSLNPLELIRWAGAPSEALVLLGSSTHAGEERVLGEIFLRLRDRFENLFLVIVPRHFERGPDVGRELEAMGIQYRFRSEFGGEVGGSETRGDCLIVNSTGELRFFYEIASVVFIGKSLLAHGGQNPIEAAAAACAVVTGPYMENFRAITKTFLKAKAMVQVKDSTELENEIGRLFEQSEERKLLGERSRSVVDRNRGAVARTVTMIEPFLHP
ncbi:3-deoxy-D-manno-octulosonic acid transferase [Verrucomicrobia bacterium]|jgi:3-deoxy-D-manno-octulosonic-acid transferase|nr:3-deoxy-D-manno-octulosonic acid transferase [Verrucomicrobiota bacterium]